MGPASPSRRDAGFGKRLWRVLGSAALAAAAIAAGLTSPDGEEGYPGTLEVSAEITPGPTELRLELAARCDATTR